MIVIAGFIKFNFIDIPFDGDPEHYITESGERLTVSRRVDGSLILSTSKSREVLLFREKSASGEKFSTKNQRLVFWRKGSNFFIEEDEKITLKGSLVDVASH